MGISVTAVVGILPPLAGEVVLRTFGHRILRDTQYESEKRATHVIVYGELIESKYSLPVQAAFESGGPEARR